MNLKVIVAVLLLLLLPCLAVRAADVPSGHSPLIGYGFDGYPIYGPYVIILLSSVYA